MKYKAVIFDLDGVIVSTDMQHYRAWKTMADDLGIYFDEEINNRLRGVSRMDSLEIILERSDRVVGCEEKSTLAESKNDMYRELLQRLTPKDLCEEVKTTLDELRKTNLKLAIGSSSKNAPLILDRLGLVDFFDAVSDGNNIKNSKPDPEVFLKAAEMLGVEPYHCAVVEDAKAGIIAAKRAGMLAIALNDAVDSPDADICLTAFSELLKTFGEVS